MDKDILKGGSAETNKNATDLKVKMYNKYKQIQGIDVLTRVSIEHFYNYLVELNGMIINGYDINPIDIPLNKHFKIYNASINIIKPHLILYTIENQKFILNNYVSKNNIIVDKEKFITLFLIEINKTTDRYKYLTEFVDRESTIYDTIYNYIEYIITFISLDYNRCMHIINKMAYILTNEYRWEGSTTQVMICIIKKILDFKLVLKAPQLSDNMIEIFPYISDLYKNDKKYQTYIITKFILFISTYTYINHIDLNAKQRRVQFQTKSSDKTATAHIDDGIKNQNYDDVGPFHESFIIYTRNSMDCKSIDPKIDNMVNLHLIKFKEYVYTENCHLGVSLTDLEKQKVELNTTKDIKTTVANLKSKNIPNVDDCMSGTSQNNELVEDEEDDDESNPKPKAKRSTKSKRASKPPPSATTRRIKQSDDEYIQVHVTLNLMERNEYKQANIGEPIIERTIQLKHTSPPYKLHRGRVPGIIQTFLLGNSEDTAAQKANIQEIQHIVNDKLLLKSNNNVTPNKKSLNILKQLLTEILSDAKEPLSDIIYKKAAGSLYVVSIKMNDTIQYWNNQTLKEIIRRKYQITDYPENKMPTLNILVYPKHS